ncbi:PREDICTED: 11-beta-hydroxysteroid dehydrogenase-like 6 [Tarenaya hassleriana]|uniref:11-beta-hydroxysteroid dehydrogenase-like 6 n=1 Tax=Tarenaya hassleriana TaxID=28532 RepID=UPI00053C7C2C|nr:PREDICTED: 11-beta-hydroxysteroid dehydrogenase-like 6 [Tarenaya hassleriana]
MDSINKMMNLIFPPIALYGLFAFHPTYQRLKSFVSVFRNIFAEDVAGKVVLITGAASGIGECIAYEYAKRGACLALVDIRGDPLFEVAALSEAYYSSPEVIPIVGDVSDVQDCERFIRATVRHFGTLDHLVTNAGIAPLYLFEDIDDLSKAAPSMDVNFWGSAYCTFFARPYLKKSRGKIVAIASGCAYIPSPKLSFYCASKAAMISFYETLRAEFGSEVGITIVVPGIIDSELSRGKFMTKDGELKVDKELRDVHVNVLPVESAEKCGKAIVRSVCRGDKYLVEPSWIDSVMLWRVFAPEVTEWLSRWWADLAKAKPPPRSKVLNLRRSAGRYDIVRPRSTARSAMV